MSSHAKHLDYIEAITRQLKRNVMAVPGHSGSRTAEAVSMLEGILNRVNDLRPEMDAIFEEKKEHS